MSIVSCLLLVSQIGTLSTFLHGQDILFCYTTGRKLMFYVLIYACQVFYGLVPYRSFSQCFFLQQHMQVFDMSSCLLFSCPSTYFTDWYLVYLFHGQDNITNNNKVFIFRGLHIKYIKLLI